MILLAVSQELLDISTVLAQEGAALIQTSLLVLLRIPGKVLLLITSFQLFPQSCRFLFFTPAHLPYLRQDVLEVFIKVQVFLFPALHRLPKALSALKLFVLCNLHVFPHLFHETRCLMFLFFPFKKSFELVTNLIPFPCFFLSSVTALWNVVHKSASLFTLSLHLLFYVIFVSFTSELSVSYSAETFLHFLFGLACSLASTELCPPLLPAGFSWCHTTLCFSTYHFSLSWPSSEPQLSSLHWTVFSSCGMSMKTTGKPCASFLS